MELHKKKIINGVQIDVGILKLIKILWDNKITTFQCCEGGYERDKETKFTHILDGKIIENAHIIFHKKDLEKIKVFLPNFTNYIVGDKNSDKNNLKYWLGSFDAVWADFIHKN